MSLKLISIPIGNSKDISLRALEEIKNCDLLIVEEKKPGVQFLKENKITKNIELLNEHSDESDINFLLEQCKSSSVCLITDCGTPGFCDPGSDLVHICRENKVSVTSVPGASSLMTFISLLGVRLDKFIFEGFISPKKEERQQKLKNIAQNIYPTILMDTPYRLMNFLEDISRNIPKAKIHLGMNLTQVDEHFFVGQILSVISKIKNLPPELHKSEFMLMVTVESRGSDINKSKIKKSSKSVKYRTYKPKVKR